MEDSSKDKLVTVVTDKLITGLANLSGDLSISENSNNPDSINNGIVKITIKGASFVINVILAEDHIL